MITAVVFLNPPHTPTPGANLRCILYRLSTSFFLCLLILVLLPRDSIIILLATLTFVPRHIVLYAQLKGAFIAGEDIIVTATADIDLA
jgi:hypothetical protein